jgi:hypothetical protein
MADRTAKRMATHTVDAVATHKAGQPTQQAAQQVLRRAAQQSAQQVPSNPLLLPVCAHAKDPLRMRNTKRISTHCVIACLLDIAFYTGYAL